MDLGGLTVQYSKTQVYLYVQLAREQILSRRKCIHLKTEVGITLRFDQKELPLSVEHI